MSEKVESGLEVVGYVDPSDLARQISVFHVQREKGLCVYEPLTLLSDAERTVQLEMERHRKTWRQLEQVNNAMRRIIERCEVFIDDEAEMSTASVEVLMGIAEDALSQQDEPECRCTLRERAVGDGCSVCNPELAAELAAELEYDEPAPAQDEREAFEECWAVRGTDDEGNLGRKPLRSLVDQQRYRGDAVNGSWVWFQRGAAWQRNRPAQTEQQPEQRNIEPLLNAGAALSNIAFNLAQRPGVTLDQHVCDLLSSARKSWDAARSALPATPSPAMDAKEE